MPVTNLKIRDLKGIEKGLFKEKVVEGWALNPKSIPLTTLNGLVTLELSVKIQTTSWCEVK